MNIPHQIIFLFIVGLSLLKSPFAQGQDIVLYGKIIDQQSQLPLGFVHISLCNQAYGTTTNEEGAFRLILSKEYQKDSLCISCIGYKTQSISIARLMAQNPATIKMQPNIKELTTIQVRSKKFPNPQKLVEKAIQKIAKNCPNRPYLIEGYYRDFLKDSSNQKISHLLETAVGIYDPGYQYSEQDTRIKIYQSRHAFGFPLDYAEFFENNLGGRSGNLSIVGGNELSVLLYNNPIRNYRRASELKTGYELNESFLMQHSFEIVETTEIEGEAVYGVELRANANHQYLLKFLATRQANEDYQMQGKMYIREKDFAILKMNYAIVRTSHQKSEILNELNLEYRPYQGKVYLHYVSFSNFIVIKREFERERYKHFRELFIHQIRTENLPSPNTFYLFNNIGKLYDQSYLQAPSFWEKYNMVLMYQP